MAKTKKEPVEEPLEKKLCKAADKLRKNMDAAEYKHVVMGLIFLKYISDAFEEMYRKLVAQKSEGDDQEGNNENTAKEVRASAIIDWTIRESERVRLMVTVKRTLNKYGYPPDKQQKAIETV